MAKKKKVVFGLVGFMTIRDAARQLGVSPNTLRNWDRKGYLVAARCKGNNYRIYSKEDLCNNHNVERKSNADD